MFVSSIFASSFFISFSLDTNKSIFVKDDLLLLKRGGCAVYFGELGGQFRTLINYFEVHGATPIDPGDNPANWMLREIPKAKEDFADLYLQSQEYCKLRRQLEATRTNPPKELELWYQSDFAVPTSERQKLMNKRLQTVYWRSPTYNLSRLLVCIIIAFFLGSVFITERRLSTLTESQIRAYFSVTFLSFIIIGILSITSVLPVMMAIRDVFYKQRAAGMVDNTALGWALGTAEKWFMILASTLFCIMYLSTAGTFPMTIMRAIKFWVSENRKKRSFSVQCLTRFSSGFLFRASSRSTSLFTHTLDRPSCAWCLPWQLLKFCAVFSLD
jgi:hypothetical protein